MRERGMEGDPRYQQMLNFARMSGLPVMGNNPAGMTKEIKILVSATFFSILGKLTFQTSF